MVPLSQRGLPIHERLVCPHVTLIHDVNVKSLVVKAVRGTVALEDGHVVGEVMMISLVNPYIIRHVSTIFVSVLYIISYIHALSSYQDCSRLACEFS